MALDTIPIPMGIAACDNLKGASSPGNPTQLYAACLQMIAKFTDVVNAAEAEFNDQAMAALTTMVPLSDPDDPASPPDFSSDPLAALAVMDTISSIDASSLTYRVDPATGAALPVATQSLEYTMKKMELVSAAALALNNPSLSPTQKNTMRQQVTSIAFFSRSTPPYQSLRLQILHQVGMTGASGSVNSEPLLSDKKRALEKTLSDTDTINVTPEDPSFSPSFPVHHESRTRVWPLETRSFGRRS